MCLAGYRILKYVDPMMRVRQLNVYPFIMAFIMARRKSLVFEIYNRKAFIFYNVSNWLYHKIAISKIARESKQREKRTKLTAGKK